MSYRDIQFDDLLHGVDVVKEYLDAEDTEHVKHVLEMIRSDIGNVKGSAAEHLHGLLMRYIDFDDHVDLQALREAINALAVACATASNIESSKQTKSRVDKLKRNTSNRYGEWQKLANKLSTTTATNRNWKKLITPSR